MKSQAIVVLIALLYLQGCSYAVNYHHSERLSVATTELKSTDPMQPLQGNIGLKVRTIVVTPGKDTAENPRGPHGEALSVISDFNLRREGNGLGFATTHIESAFITGAAARKAPPASASALSGGALPLTGTVPRSREVMLSNMYLQIKDMATTDASAATHLQALDDLHKRLPEQMVLDELTRFSASNTVEHDYEQVDGISFERRNNFTSVLAYEAALAAAIGDMDELRDNRLTTLKEQPLSAEDLATIARAREALVRLLEDYQRNILRSAAVERALQYLLNAY